MAFALSLDGNYVGTPAPSQMRFDDIFPAVLPGTDEMLKLSNGPGIFQVPKCAIDPAEKSLPVIDQPIRGCGHPSLRMTHHPLCLADVPLDV